MKQLYREMVKISISCNKIFFIFFFILFSLIKLLSVPPLSIYTRTHTQCQKQNPTEPTPSETYITLSLHSLLSSYGIIVIADDPMREREKTEQDRTEKTKRLLLFMAFINLIILFISPFSPVT